MGACIFPSPRSLQHDIDLLNSTRVPNIKFWVTRVQNEDDEKGSIKKQKMHTRHLSSKGGYHGPHASIDLFFVTYSRINKKYLVLAWNVRLTSVSTHRLRAWTNTAVALDSEDEYRSHLWVLAFFLPRVPSVQCYDSIPPVFSSAWHSNL